MPGYVDSPEYERGIWVRRRQWRSNRGGCLLLQGFCVLRNLLCCRATVTRFGFEGKGSARGYFVFFFVRFVPFLSTLPTPFAPTHSPHHILNMAGPKLEVFKVQGLETCSGRTNLMEFGSTIEINYGQEGGRTLHRAKALIHSISSAQCFLCLQ